MLSFFSRRVQAALRAALALSAASWLLDAAGGYGAESTAPFTNVRRQFTAASSLGADAVTAAAVSSSARRAWLDADAPKRGDSDFAAAYAPVDSPLRRLFAPVANSAAACAAVGSGEIGVCATRTLVGALRAGLPCAAYSIGERDGSWHAIYAASVRAAAPACDVRNFSVAEAFGDGALSTESSRMWWAPDGYAFVLQPLRRLLRRFGHERLAALRIDAPAFAWDLALGTEWFRLSVGQLQLRLPLANRSIADVDEVLRAIGSAGFVCARFDVQLGFESAARGSSLALLAMLDVTFVSSDDNAAVPADWDDPTEPLIITGTSSNHVSGLHGLLRSIVEQSAGDSGASGLPAITVHIWDLGLTPGELAALHAAFPPSNEASLSSLSAKKNALPLARTNTSAHVRHITVRFHYFTFDFGAVPAHFALARETYAWKAEIVGREILDLEDSRCYNPVLWLDAGDRVTSPLEKILGAVRKNGASSAHSSGYAMTWTHPLMVSFFADRRWLRSVGDFTATDTPCAGCTIALDRDNARTLSRIVRRWRTCAWREECIAPPGSSRANHRQDQAALTLLFIAADVPKRCGYDSPISKGILTHAGGRRRIL